MLAKDKSSETQSSSCPYCNCRVKSAKLEKHLQNVHLIKEFVTIHECALEFRINERKVLELAQQFGCTVNLATDRIPISIAKKIEDIFGFRSQSGIRRPKSSPTKVEARFVKGGLPSLGKKK